MRAAHRLEKLFSGARYKGTTKVVNGNPVWTGKVRLNPAVLDKPLRWKKPRRIFVNSMSDLFHESLSDEDIDRVFAVMALAPQHQFQVLTKRAQRMQEYMLPPDVARLATVSWPLPNVWLGVSVEDQTRADERIPLLLDTPAAVRFLSCEPLLGPVELPPRAILLDWIIVGGESGPGARGVKLSWIKSLVDQCRDSGTACFVKQLGSRPTWTMALKDGTAEIPLSLKHSKGGEPAEWPTWACVREFPQTEVTA